MEDPRWLCPVVEVALHVDCFRNVDLFHQGLYYLRFSFLRISPNPAVILSAAEPLGHFGALNLLLDPPEEPVSGNRVGDVQGQPKQDEHPPAASAAALAAGPAAGPTTTGPAAGPTAESSVRAGVAAPRNRARSRGGGNSRSVHSLTPSILDGPFFCTQSFFVRYCEEEISLNEVCCFRLRFRTADPDLLTTSEEVQERTSVASSGSHKNYTTDRAVFAGGVQPKTKAVPTDPSSRSSSLSGRSSSSAQQDSISSGSAFWCLRTELLFSDLEDLGGSERFVEGTADISAVDFRVVATSQHRLRIGPDEAQDFSSVGGGATVEDERGEFSSCGSGGGARTKWSSSMSKYALHEYFPVVFDDAHFCSVGVMVHATLVGFEAGPGGGAARRGESSISNYVHHEIALARKSFEENWLRTLRQTLAEDQLRCFGPLLGRADPRMDGNKRKKLEDYTEIDHTTLWRRAVSVLPYVLRETCSLLRLDYERRRAEMWRRDFCVFERFPRTELSHSQEALGVSHTAAAEEIRKIVDKNFGQHGKVVDENFLACAAERAVIFFQEYVKDGAIGSVIGDRVPTDPPSTRSGCTAAGSCGNAGGASSSSCAGGGGRGGRPCTVPAALDLPPSAPKSRRCVVRPASCVRPPAVAQTSSREEAGTPVRNERMTSGPDGRTNNKNFLPTTTDNAPSSELSCPSLHLFVLVHGFQGSSADVRLFRNNLALAFPEALFLASTANEDNTECSFEEMAEKLAQEIEDYVAEYCPVTVVSSAAAGSRGERGRGAGGGTSARPDGRVSGRTPSTVGGPSGGDEGLLGAAVGYPRRWGEGVLDAALRRTDSSGGSSPPTMTRDKKAPLIPDTAAAFSCLGSVSFVCHSIGGLIARAAVPLLPTEIRHKLHTYISFSSPHLGYGSTDVSGLVSTALWVLKKLKRYDSLEQLTLGNNNSGTRNFVTSSKENPSGSGTTIIQTGSRLRDCFLYRLSGNGALQMFQNVVLVSSPQDQYAPYSSARIERPRPTPVCSVGPTEQTKETKTSLEQQESVANVTAEMAERCFGAGPPDPPGGGPGGPNVFRFDVCFSFAERNFDTFVGRAAHIQFLENDVLLRGLVEGFSFLFR